MLSYRSLVFAGGGNRCVWQGGFWDVVSPHLQPPPRVVVGVSAGAFMACVALSGRARWGLDWMQRVTAGITRNFEPANLFLGLPVFPHPRVYRRAVLEVLDGPALERLRRGPEIRVLMARPPRWLGPRSAVVLGFLCYGLEKYLRGPLHPTWALALGFTPLVERADTCADSRQLADLILASSCTPPILPPMFRQGRPVLDGGLVDNVPVAALAPEEHPALVLLSRRYPPHKLKGHPGRTYVQPSRPIPVGKWDYTNPQGVEETYRLGREDGLRFLESQGGDEAPGNS